MCLGHRHARPVPLATSPLQRGLQSASIHQTPSVGRVNTLLPDTNRAYPANLESPTASLVRRNVSHAALELLTPYEGRVFVLPVPLAKWLKRGLLYAIHLTRIRTKFLMLTLRHACSVVTIARHRMGYACLALRPPMP